jgi:hypothetical protein
MGVTRSLVPKDETTGRALRSRFFYLAKKSQIKKSSTTIPHAKQQRLNKIDITQML